MPYIRLLRALLRSLKDDLPVYKYNILKYQTKFLVKIKKPPIVNRRLQFILRVN